MSEMTNRKQKYSDDQFWQAFQFVAGELSADQSELFELQMLDSPAMCEAVAEAVRLSSAVAAESNKAATVLSPTVVRCEAAMPRRSTSGKSAVAIVATVCCCLLLLLIVPTDSGSESSVAATDKATVEAELLVSAWAAGFTDDFEDDVNLSETDQHELDVPDWMLAAVTLTDDEDPDSNDGVDAHADDRGRPENSLLF